MKDRFGGFGDTEDDLREDLVRMLGPRAHVQRHEDRIDTGIPDLSLGYAGKHAWIELKVRNSIPDLNKKFDISNLTAKQKRWLTDRAKFCGGRTYILFRATDWKTLDCLWMLIPAQHLGLIGQRTLSGMMEVPGVWSVVTRAANVATIHSGCSVPSWLRNALTSVAVV